jgi:dipeptidyl-peptidase-4
MTQKQRGRQWLLAAAGVAALSAAVAAQDRLRSMPGYDQFQKMSKELAGAVKSGALTVTWSEDAKSFEYTHDGKRYRFDVATRKAIEAGEPRPPPAGGGPGGRGRPPPPKIKTLPTELLYRPCG